MSAEPAASKPEKPPKRTLLQKYDIPVQNLDFDYIRGSHDAREIEHIYAILKSGQEGHFPDLTQCAEKRLRELNPHSRALRVETPLLNGDALPKQEWNTICGELNDHVADIQQKSATLRAASDAFGVELPPIRTQEASVNCKNMGKPGLDRTGKKSPATRIKSTDYEQWDKYDADTEINKMDLAEEQARESAALTDKTNARSIDQIVADAQCEEHTQHIARLNAIEQSACAERCRIDGNEHFRAADYADAIFEYTRSIAVHRTALALSNRAMAYLKIGENQKAVNDCDACLELDSTNVKAMLRKAVALQNEDRHTEAFDVYTNVLRVDANNKIAAESVRKLRDRNPNLPPPNATRVRIQDINDAAIENVKSPTITPTPCIDEHVDFAALIMPKKIVPSKLSKMAQTLGQQTKTTPKTQSQNDTVKTSASPIVVTAQKSSKTQISGQIPTQSTNKQRTEYKNGVIIEEL